MPGVGSGLDLVRASVFGGLARRVLVAGGALQGLNGTVQHVGIVTHQANRWRGSVGGWPAR